MKIRIYELYNKVNKKSYIGITKKPIAVRVEQHIYDAKRRRNSIIIGKALLKYGRKNFKVKLLTICYSLKSAYKTEKEFIKSKNTLAPNGYNLREGGVERSFYSNVLKKDLSVSIKNSWVQGRKLSQKQLAGLELGRKTNCNKKHIGETNPRAKLKKYEVLEIKQLYKSGNYSQEKLGQKFGVKQVTISKIITGENWSSLSNE